MTHVRIYLCPQGKPLMVMDGSKIGKKPVIEQIHKELKVKGYPARFISMEVTGLKDEVE